MRIKHLGLVDNDGRTALNMACSGGQGLLFQAVLAKMSPEHSLFRTSRDVQLSMLPQNSKYLFAKDL